MEERALHSASSVDNTELHGSEVQIDGWSRAMACDFVISKTPDVSVRAATTITW